MLRRMPVKVRTRGAISAQPSPATLARRARCMLAALKLERAELSLVLCDDRTMRALNRRHRGLDRPTDVLAFALGEGPAMPSPGARLLGDVVISLSTARRQAREQGRTPLAEATMLLAHGLLHLLGFDHRTASEERRMRARTDALVAASSGRGRSGYSRIRSGRRIVDRAAESGLGAARLSTSVSAGSRNPSKIMRFRDEGETGGKSRRVGPIWATVWTACGHRHS
jgi:probable rRNA maturation factor